MLASAGMALLLPPLIMMLTTVQTMEVAIARVYNWEVVQKRKEKADEGDDEEGSKENGASPND